MVSGQELNAIQALASRNFFNPSMIEAGTAYPQPDKKILHLGLVPFSSSRFISIYHFASKHINVFSSSAVPNYYLNVISYFDKT